jgi:hypothetical protein
MESIANLKPSMILKAQGYIDQSAPSGKTFDSYTAKIAALSVFKYIWLIATIGLARNWLTACFTLLFQRSLWRTEKSLLQWELLFPRATVQKATVPQEELAVVTDVLASEPEPEKVQQQLTLAPAVVTSAKMDAVGLPVGIVRRSFTCYFIATLNCMFHIVAFRTLVYALDVITDNVRIHLLAKMFYHLETSTAPLPADDVESFMKTANAAGDDVGEGHNGKFGDAYNTFFALRNIVLSIIGNCDQDNVKGSIDRALENGDLDECKLQALMQAGVYPDLSGILRDISAPFDFREQRVHLDENGNECEREYACPAIIMNIPPDCEDIHDALNKNCTSQFYSGDYLDCNGKKAVITKRLIECPPEVLSFVGNMRYARVSFTPGVEGSQGDFCERSSDSGKSFGNFFSSKINLAANTVAGEEVLYELKGMVVNHSESHYTFYVRIDGSWWHINDSCVRKISDEEFSMISMGYNNSPRLVFYEKCNS